MAHTKDRGERLLARKLKDVVRGSRPRQDCAVRKGANACNQRRTLVERASGSTDPLEYEITYGEKQKAEPGYAVHVSADGEIYKMHPTKRPEVVYL